MQSSADLGALEAQYHTTTSPLPDLATKLEREEAIALRIATAPAQSDADCASKLRIMMQIVGVDRQLAAGVCTSPEEEIITSCLHTVLVYLERRR